MVCIRWHGITHTRTRISPTECQQEPSTLERTNPPQQEHASFSDLPQQLLECILVKLKGVQGSLCSAKDIFSAIGVCRSWRAAGHAVFFRDSWSSCNTHAGPIIQHPAQLIALCPLHHSTGGHIKCYMQRHVISSSLTGKAHKFILCQGADPAKHNGKFLLAALQDGKQQYAIFLNRSCSGNPIAYLHSNFMRTAYTLTTAAAASDSSRQGGSSSSGSSQGIKKSASQQQQQQQHGWCSCALCGSSSTTAAAAAAAAANAVQRQELAHVEYKLRVRGLMLPRRMSVAVPAPHVWQQQQRKARSCAQPSAAAADILPHIDQDLTAVASPMQQQQVPHSPSFKAALQLQLQQQQQQHTHWQQQQQDAHLHHLRNKPPHWNDALRCWCLNFRGRVRLASVKNFQLVTDPNLQHTKIVTNLNVTSDVTDVPDDQSTHGSDSSEDNNSSSSSGDDGSSWSSGSSSSSSSATTAATAAAAAAALKGSPHSAGIIIQFGKVEKDVYILDYDPVLMTGLQAFAVALTSFGTKVLL